ncbi:MAG TPA: threonine--tRNA ligase [Kiritimatiellia bacterium]|nr:threonine--tRNA ligase [Kiritimatiellia bacterium]HPJ56870.1 threonine--tRNA ligase [Kiritimatiellia bacterium]
MKPDSVGLETMRHSAAHVMASAVQRLWPDALFDIGPDTEDGFYYDFDLKHRLTEEDFPAIEAEMARIVAEDLPFVREEKTREEVLELMKGRGQTYKLERLADIPEGETISLYHTGDFTDLCRGPHVKSTGAIKAFKLQSVAGAYFRGDEKNQMMQRLYGTAFLSQADLEAHLKMLEEAKLRDHRVLGRDLDLFSIQESVGPGLVHWHPKGARIRATIEEFWRREHFRAGYEMLYTPHIGRAGLWETSGHLGFYSENMYAPMEIDEQRYYIKPMNCPFHIQIYQNRKRSYRELPLRWAELGTVYRYERAGVLHGLMRVRGFTQDDAHIYCTEEQVEQEVRDCVRFAIAMWRAFGFEDITAYLATRPEKAVGDPARWELAQRSLEAALKAEHIPFEMDEGGGAFYGPKIDLKTRDAIGRQWQMSTVQFDFNLPDRFDMTYTGPDGQDHRPYMVHRALLGSLERFFGILIEHYAGAFPLWLAPVQAVLIPVTDKQIAAAEEVAAKLRAKDFRVQVDGRPEKMGAKIRDAQMQKIPYMLVMGGREIENGTVSVRSRVAGDEGAMPLEAFIDKLDAERRVEMN